MHKALFEKYSTDLHSTLYDVFNGNGGDVNSVLYFKTDQTAYNIFCREQKTIYLYKELESYPAIVTTIDEYGNLHVKNYGNRKAIALVTFKKDFDVVGNYSDIITILANNHSLLTQLDYNKEMARLLNNYMSL